MPYYILSRYLHKLIIRTNSKIKKLNIYIKQMKMASIQLLLSLLIIYTTAFPICQKMQISGYWYDLSKMPASSLLMAKDTPGFVQFSFCEPSKTCGTQKSFAVLNNNNNSCKVYSNKLNPLRQNYAMIDVTTPKIGVKITYLPYYDATVPIYRTTVLNVHCPSVSKAQTICKYTKVSDTSQNIECHIEADAGCATIKLNSFWQFLYDNSIVFAILLWIMALFELLFGYLAIRITIFVFGILSGVIFGIIFTAENYVNFIYESEGYGIAIFVVCLSFLMGILFGISLLTLPRLGYVNIGLWVAVIFSLLLQNSVLYLTGTLLAFYITVGVVGLLMACIALLKLKNYIIISTSFISAFWMVRPLGFFLPSYPNQLLSGEAYLLNSSTDWQFYLYLIAIIILTILGATFQFCCFKKSASGNENYYLQEQGSFKEKLKKLLEFEEIRNLVKSGAEQLKFFKQLLVDESQDQNSYRNTKDRQKGHSREDIEQISEQKSQPQKSFPYIRKKTKLEKEMEDYQGSKKKQDSKKPKIIFPVQKLKSKGQPEQKSKGSEKSIGKNRKVVQLQSIEMSQEDDNFKKIDASEQQESQDIRPNRLYANRKS